MPRCDACDVRIAEGRQWIELTHNYPRMRFDSSFCSAECATTYLDSGLFEADLQALCDAE
ncbi:hypothetical protein [Halomarina rubra]|uniref:MYM-type domain-containing protein n=1 Tax=Halomarina rubra TaxID=2071873 RepID=A0ABD6B1W9_9EURY|nr:hypothetical protein [Halomarina rubra]